jgi:hypothetical protein
LRGVAEGGGRDGQGPRLGEPEWFVVHLQTRCII